MTFARKLLALMCPNLADLYSSPCLFLFPHFMATIFMVNLLVCDEDLGGIIMALYEPVVNLHDVRET